jgi:RNA-directed DNA polymerase
VCSFDTIDHGWLVKFVEHRIGDPRIVRLIQKWLRAGILEERWRPSEEGVPQGATASPLLANIFLHYVFDLWVDQWRKRHAHGQVIVVRYADDIAIGFQYESDARRLQTELRTRLQQFGLELHPEKTRLIEFGRFAAEGRRRRGQRKPETFTMLGFTHACGKTQRGKFLLIRRTSGKRMREKLHELRAEIMRRRHQPIKEQGRWLGSVVRGYFAYHAVPTNSDGITTYYRQVSRYWYHALRRRSQKHKMTWRRLTKLTDRFLPAPRVTLPWPEQHFDKTRGGSRVR